MKANTTTDTFPSKIYTILACAKSVIVQADEGSELSDLIRTHRCGRVVAPGSPRAYAEAIAKAYDERTTLRSEGESGRQFVLKEYSKEAVAQKYDRLIKDLVEGKA